uniref:Transcriptional regulator n=1 Tax=Caenorhabditis tropicalis TaxID=1561998 RepID=A0A1I7TRV5_9PELO
MGELEVPERELEYFATSARAGRRNALPEIEVEIDDPEAAKLAERISDMTAHCDATADSQNQPGPSQPNQGKS